MRWVLIVLQGLLIESVTLYPTRREAIRSGTRAWQDAEDHRDLEMYVWDGVEDKPVWSRPSDEGESKEWHP